MDAAAVIQLLEDTGHKMQIGQSRVIIQALEIQAKRYATGESPRVSPQIALQAFADALKRTVEQMEAKYGRVPV